MKIGCIFGTCIGVGMLIALMFDQKYIMQGAWTGIAVSGLIVMKKSKKDGKK